jgi:putative restriction endonuclease
MSEVSWKDLIGNIHTWKIKRGKREFRAVHKPLLTLMILARAQKKGGSNEFHYREIEKPLLNALRNFGRPNKKDHPEYPFWHLRSDKFWTIPDAHRLKSPPSCKALRDADAVGKVDDKLWAELRQKPALPAELATQILQEFWPESIHDTIAAELGVDLDRAARPQGARGRDPGFRADVLRAYEWCCAICGFQARLGHAFIGLEAAHIQFWQDDGPDVVQNGVLLCSLHHKAFDLGAIGIGRDLRILISQDVDANEPARRLLVAYSGERLKSTQTPADRPGALFLRWHEEWVFRGPARPAASTASR